MRTMDESAWLKYRDHFPAGFRPGDMPFPRQLSYTGAIQCLAHPIPPARLLEALAMWLAARGEDEIYLFVTETDRTIKDRDYLVPGSELTPATFQQIEGYFYEKVLSSKTLSWAIFIDSNGVVHVAGDPDLYRRLASALS